MPFTDFYISHLRPILALNITITRYKRESIRFPPVLARSSPSSNTNASPLLEGLFVHCLVGPNPLAIIDDDEPLDRDGARRALPTPILPTTASLLCLRDDTWSPCRRRAYHDLTPLITESKRTQLECPHMSLCANYWSLTMGEFRDPVVGLPFCAFFSVCGGATTDLFTLVSSF